MIICLLHKAKVCSRADLAVATGLKQATITNIINELIERGLVIEVGNIEGRMKRRSIGISLNKEYQSIGICLEREYYKVGLSPQAMTAPSDFNPIEKYPLAVMAATSVRQVKCYSYC